MDRQAILLNLRDLRDLEMAKICVTKKRKEDWNSYQSEINSLSSVQYQTVLPENNGLGNIIGLIVSLFALAGGGALTYLSWSHLGSAEGWPPILNIIGAILHSSIWSILGVVCGVLLIIGALFALKHVISSFQKASELKEQNQRAKRHNAIEQARFEENQPEINQLKKEQHEADIYWETAQQKIKDLLDETYSVKLIPKPYRYKLAAIQYIYEYMESSNVSLEHALRSAQIEDGIQRVEAKLNVIISQQDEILFQMHCQQVQSRQMIETNEQMLDSLQRTEKNTLEAAQYAQISASNSETCAFFAEASYFGQLFDSK